MVRYVVHLLLYSTLFYSTVLYYSLLYSTLFHSTLLYSILLYFTQLNLNICRRKFRSETSDNMDGWKSTAMEKVRSEKIRGGEA